MNKKLLYSAPEAELLVIRFEENFLQGPSNPEPGTLPGDEIDDQGEF